MKAFWKAMEISLGFTADLQKWQFERWRGADVFL